MTLASATTRRPCDRRGLLIDKSEAVINQQAGIHDSHVRFVIGRGPSVTQFFTPTGAGLYSAFLRNFARAGVGGPQGGKGSPEPSPSSV